jgi:triosephosphate isomerase
MANRKYIVGNWKMNGMREQLPAVIDLAEAAKPPANVDVAMCPPVTLIASAVDQDPSFSIGAQDCHFNAGGAHTGNMSAAMISEVGAGFSIIGHSERRADQGETDADVKGKAEALHALDMGAIICVGETEAERDAGNAVKVVTEQLSGSFPDDANGNWLTIAYEPVWAIGTGRVPKTSDVEDMHRAIREKLNELMEKGGASVRILYGGSMNGSNAAELLAVANVDGGLVGGASLSAEKFGPIIVAASKA